MMLRLQFRNSAIYDSSISSLSILKTSLVSSVYLYLKIACKVSYTFMNLNIDNLGQRYLLGFLENLELGGEPGNWEREKVSPRILRTFGILKGTLVHECKTYTFLPADFLPPSLWTVMPLTKSKSIVLLLKSIIQYLVVLHAILRSYHDVTYFMPYRVNTKIQLISAEQIYSKKCNKSDHK